MSKPFLECPRCRQEWHITGDGKVLCHSCGYETDSYNGAVEFIEKIMGITKSDNIKTKLPVYHCPNCENPAMVDQGGAGRLAGPRFFCFSCGNQWFEKELERCPECNQLQPGGEFEELIICRSSVGFYVCRSCYEKIFK